LIRQPVNTYLGDYVNFQNGYAFKSTEYTTKGNYLIRIKNVQQGYIDISDECFVTIPNETKYEKFKLKNGDIVVSLTGNVGRIARIRNEHLPAVLNQRVASVSPKSDKVLSVEYLYYLLRTPEFLEFAIDSGKGAAQQNISTSDMEKFEVCIPPLVKQREIVKVLDSTFAEIDLLEDLHSKSNDGLLESLFDTYRDAILTSACAGSTLVEFGEIGNFVRGPFGGSLKKSIFKQTGLAVYEQQHAIYDHFESFRYFIDEEKYREMKRFEVKSDDIIMSCSGTYGKIAVVPEGSPKGIINQALLKISPDKGVRSHFIKHWMQSSLFQMELEKDIGGAALQNVPSVSKMKSIKIRLPEEKIQIELIHKLDQVQAEIKLARKIQERIGTNYVELRQSILSSAFNSQKAVA
jgi:type I restriction enzyme S subunit